MEEVGWRVLNLVDQERKKAQKGFATRQRRAGVCGWMFFVPRKQLAASFEMGDDDRLVRGSGYFFCVRDIPSYAYEIALRGNLTALLWRVTKAPKFHARAISIQEKASTH